VGFQICIAASHIRSRIQCKRDGGAWVPTSGIFAHDEISRWFGCFWVPDNRGCVAGCTMKAKQEDDALVKAGFTKTNPNAPGAASVAKSDPILYLHFVHRTVNGVPMVFYYDPIACKCVYSGTEA
jgi:hypothetical protein